MKKAKLFTWFVLLSLALSSCGNADKNDTSKDNKTDSGEEVVYADENALSKGSQTIAAPNEPLSLDEAFSEITISGTKFQLPCKASDFSGDFSYKPSDQSEGWYDIYYQNTNTGSFVYEDVYNYDIEKDYIYSLSVYGDFEIGGFVSGQKQSDAVKYFGEPDETIAGQLWYQTDDRSLVFSKSMFGSNESDDTISDVHIIFGSRPKEPDEDVFRKVTVCGTEFSVPFKASDLTGDFSYKENGDHIDILHNDKTVGEFAYPENVTDRVNAVPFSVTLNENADFIIGDFSEGMTLTELRKKLGKPAEQLVSLHTEERFDLESIYSFRDLWIDFRNTKMDKSQAVDYVCFYFDVEDGHIGHFDKKGSFEEVNKLVIGGKETSLPFTIDSLGDGYSRVAGHIEKNGDTLGLLVDSDVDEIYTFSVYRGVDSSVNGLDMSSTKEQIEAVLGEPSSSAENLGYTYDMYYYDGGEITISYFGKSLSYIQIYKYHWE